MAGSSFSSRSSQLSVLLWLYLSLLQCRHANANAQALITSTRSTSGASTSDAVDEENGPSSTYFGYDFNVSAYAHQLVLYPEPFFTVDGEVFRYQPLAYLEDQGFNTSADPTTTITKLQYSTLRTFLDDEERITITEGALFDCGFTDINTETQYIPADGIMRTTGYIYDGPCEVWLDDTLVMSGSNCRDEYPGQTFPIDYSSCKGECVLRWYWLGVVPVSIDAYSWQVYKNCVALKGYEDLSAKKKFFGSDLDVSTFAHQLVLYPVPFFTVDGEAFRYQPLAYLEKHGVETSADATQFLKQQKYSTLRDMMNDDKLIEVTEGALFDCGFTDINTETQPIPNDRIMRTTGYIYDGPCEVWLDDILVMSGGNCRDKYPGQTFPIDYSSCKGSCILSWFWLGIVPLGGERYSWQVYKNCVALDDSKMYPKTQIVSDAWHFNDYRVASSSKLEDTSL